MYHPGGQRRVTLAYVVRSIKSVSLTKNEQIMVVNSVVERETLVFVTIDVFQYGH